MTLCDINSGHQHPIAQRVFDLIHGLFHPSGLSTAKLLKQKFWHDMSDDTKQYARTCIPCQSNKVTRHTKSGISDFYTPRRFGHIHMDIASPLLPSEGSRYLFITIDRSACRFEAVPMAEASSSSCASALLSGWISRFVVPEHITSHHGMPFT